MAHIKVCLLGAFQVSRDEAPITDFDTDKARALLAYLVVERAHPHRREKLAALLWPDQPEERARQNLRQALVSVRHAIRDEDASPFLLISTREIQIHPDASLWSDVGTFHALAKVCEQHRHRGIDRCAACLRRQQEMAQLYQGDFLANISVRSEAYEEWLIVTREELHVKAMRALEILAGYYELRGDYAAARSFATRQVQMEPWREEAHAQIMKFLALEGQRSAALAQYTLCRQMLANTFGVEPSSSTQAQLFLIQQEGGALRTQRPAPPQASTHFVGRARERAELADMLANPDCRLVTILGIGGVGKTRIALQLAHDQAGLFRDGILFVSLSAVEDMDTALVVLADALQLAPSNDPITRICEALKDRQMLIVLDNFEHLCADGQILTNISGKAAGVQWLITSRERLRLCEEWVFILEGLPYPDEKQPPGALVSFDAIHLFETRAAQVNPRFQITPEVQPAVNAICRLLEGLPLGLELAAASLADSNCAAIAAALRETFDSLAEGYRNLPSRHRSLRAAFEHSWSHLTPAARARLARLAVFAASFTPDAAQTVAQANMEDLALLVDKSLLRRETHGRYGMHAVIRQFALEKHAECLQGEDSPWRHYARLYLGMLAQLEADLRNERQVEALQSIRQEIDHIRACWSWAIEQKEIALLEVAFTGLVTFYEVSGSYREADGTLKRLEKLLSGNPQTQASSFYGAAMGWLGYFAYRLARYDDADRLFEQAFNIARANRDEPGEVFAQTGTGIVAIFRGDLDRARELLEDCLSRARLLEDDSTISRVMNLLGIIAKQQGQYELSRQYHEQTLAIYQRLGDPHRIAISLNNLGILARIMGDYPRALGYYQENLALRRKINDLRGIALASNNLGNLLALMGKFPASQAAFQESLALYSEIGDDWGISLCTHNLGDLAKLQGDLDRAAGHYQNSLSIRRQLGDRPGIAYSLAGLGHVAAARGDSQAATGHFQDAARQAVESRQIPVLIDVIAAVAEIKAASGSPETAGLLAQFVCQHPSADAATRQRIGALAERISGRAAGKSPQSAEEALVLAFGSFDRISLNGTR